MATEAQLIEALRRADQAGNTADAQQIANALKEMRNTAPNGYADSYVSQALSGAYEGVANTLGAPVDLANAAFGVGLSAVNRVAGTDFTASEKPFLGGDQIKEALAGIGVIGQRSRDRKKQFARRVGQGVGEVAPFAAGGIGGARTLVSGLTSGVGGASAQQLFPDNPAAEAIGSLLGGLAPTAFESVASKVNAARDLKRSTPTTEALKESASDLYREAERSGFTAPPQKTKGLHSSLRNIAAKEGLITPKSDAITDTMPKVRAALKMTEEFAGSSMTPEQMQTVRKSLQNAAGSIDANEARVGSMMLQRFDDFTSGFAPQFKQARSLYHRAKKAEILELAAVRASERAGGFSASGYENALRTEYRAIAQKINSGKLKGFTKEELAAIRRVSRGTAASNAARMAGKLAPNNVVSGGVSLGGGYALGGPIGAAGMAGVGYGGRALATRMGIDAANTAELLVRAGVTPDKVRALSPQQIEALAAVLAAQANHPIAQEASASAPSTAQ